MVEGGAFVINLCKPGKLVKDENSDWLLEWSDFSSTDRQKAAPESNQFW